MGAGASSASAWRREAQADPLNLVETLGAFATEGESTTATATDAAARQQGLGNMVAGGSGAGTGFIEAQQGIGNAAVVARESGASGTGESQTLDATTEPTDAGGESGAITILGTDLSAEETPLTETEGETVAPAENPPSTAEDPGSMQQGKADAALVPADVAGGDGDVPGGQTEAVTSVAGGGLTSSSFATPLVGFVPSGRPLPLNADNAGTLTGIVRENARILREAIASSAQQALNDAFVRGARMSAAIDASALSAFALVRSEADATIASLEAEAAARIDEVSRYNTICEAEFDLAIDDALLAFEAAYIIESDNVAATIEAKANAILAYGAERAAAVRESVPARIERARSLRDEAYQPYTAHEDRDDVWEAVDGVFKEAEQRFKSGAEETASAIEGFARDAAAAWRQEVPPHNAELIAVWDRSVAALEAERLTLKADLADKTTQLSDELALAAADGAAKIELAVADFDTAVEEARVKAQGELAAATDAHMMAIEAAAADTTAQLDVLEAAMIAEIGALKSETGGIFDPEDARPALARGFGAIAGQWNGRAAAAEKDFAADSEGAGTTFESRVATSQAVATADMVTQSDSFATVSATFMTDVATVQTDALALAQGQVDSAAALVGADLSATAVTIVNALDAGYKVAADNISQTEYKMTATHNGAVYKLRSAYQDAITEALKAWYEKLWDWLVDVVGTIIGAVADFFVWLGKTVVNIVWGFIWGEAAFPEAWGAGAITFVADLVAGVLIYGDIRDLFKWGFWKPVVMGEEWTWMNSMMIGLSLVGLIPAYGDVIKILGKGGVKALVKELGERLTRELLEEFGERGAAEAVVERLLKDLGPEAIKELTEKLGVRGFRELVDAFSEQGLKQLIGEIGSESVGRLAKTFGAPGLKTAVEAFTGPVLRDLAAELGEKALKETIDALGAGVAKDLIGVVGAAGLKDLTTHFTLPGLRILLDGATGLSARTLGDLTQEFGAPALKELVDGIGVPAVKGVVEVAGAAGLKELTTEFTVTGMRQLLDAATGLTPRAVGELADDLGARGLKEIADELTLPVLRQLADAGTGIGTRSLADLAGAISRVDLGKLVRKVKPAGLAQMVTDMGADRLARTINAAGYDAFARGIGRVRDPLAIAAKAASYSARTLGEALDVTRRFGANTATFRVGTSGAVESTEATLSQVSTGLARSGAETSAQRGVVSQVGDEGGHIIGHRFLSDQNRLNMFSQAAHLNDPVFKVLENEIADWIRRGATIRMSVELVDAAAGRPSAVRVLYTAVNSAGTDVFSRGVTFLNQAGQTFTRLSPGDISARLAGSTP